MDKLCRLKISTTVHFMNIKKFLKPPPHLPEILLNEESIDKKKLEIRS